MMEGEQTEIRVTTFPSAEPLLRLSPSAGQSAAVGYFSEIECVHGERRVNLYCVIDGSLPRDSISMSVQAARQLKLTEYTWLMPAGLSSHRIQFGPLIGILANPQWDKEKRTLKKSKQLESLERLVEMGRMYGAVCFLFSISGVDLRAGTIRGYVQNDGRWHRRVLPMPDVIYDQLVSRKLERDPAVQDKRQALSRRYGRKFFNDGFFDKWQVYEWLQEDLEVRAHVPHTVRHTTIPAAVAFLSSHQTAFLKPLHGSLGLGIARFVKQRDGSFLYELKQNTSYVTRGKAASAKDAVQTFRTRLKNRPYIWQEGLWLATYQNRPVDIRILMQRDHTGNWKRTKMFARVAKSGDFTSNLTGGGDAMPVDDALLECLPKVEQRTKAKGQIRRLSHKIAEAIEKQSGRTFGELGIDLGLDLTGKVWVIEVNSKPRKAPSTEKGRKDLVDLSFERPIRYAIYLAKSTS
ncbi:YheC/YheD family endospore coat-associated protein [Alicyclobacillus dauci]|uniref:YheC/YheD family protein n=1 Tax=Alicyclobacillus dauci TaxID=1475485 RepID=A0ABY6YY31_9BACL|nr:YheC/YheD family protein [Alicyclobacillus dauci]WAH35332.1 YheC/YheD family protein [Alicyclobacillus dauci]